VPCPSCQNRQIFVVPYITQLQAAGSSMLAKLAVCLAADALRVAGVVDLGAVTMLPVATGMAMTLSLLAIKATRFVITR
jgi:O-phospho-L-seryl-tRNASec:L-selenocysteinyl-tRNA synthase